MALFRGDKIQDTIKSNKVSSTDTLYTFSQKPVSLKVVVVSEKPDRAAAADTSLICKRNSIADVTFYDSTAFVRTLQYNEPGKTIYSIVSGTKQYTTERRETLLHLLKEGNLINRSYGTDWIILILLASAFLLSIVRPVGKNFQSAIRFVLFRGLKDSEYGESGGLFHWQTTIQNLISFSVIALFIYHAVSFYGGLPPLHGIFFWSLVLAGVIVIFTLRYLVCIAAGSLSGEREAFSEYISGICQSYHIIALFLFILVVLITFTKIAPAGVLLITGFIWAGLIYMLRVLRLLIIFINRNISVFYLILYLCALEILPVAIAIRYFSGTL